MNSKLNPGTVIMRIRSAALSMAMALSLASCGAPARIADVAITNVTVIDAVNGVREGRTVLVDDGRITAVTSADTDVDATESIDGTGQYLIPGLWDFHVHFTYDDRLTDAMPGLFLSHGITSVRDTGGLLDRILPVVQRLRAEGAVGPRVFFAGPLMDGRDIVYDGEGRPWLGIANPDPETARANLAHLVDAGVDFIKIYEMVTPKVFQTLVEEAQARGMPIGGHVPLSMLAREVGPLVQSLEHLRNEEMDCVANAEKLRTERRRLLRNPDGLSGSALRLRLHNLQRLPAIAAYDDAECDAMIASMANTIQVPTLRLNAISIQSPFQRSDWDAELTKLPESVAEEWRAATATARQVIDAQDTTYAHWSLFLVNRMNETGVPIAAGTDTPIGFAAPGYSLHSEMEMLVRAGLTPMQALEAATVRPAQFFGHTAEMGTVEKGRLADLVLLSANPLEDVANIRTVQAVVTKGDLLTRTELDAMVQ